MMVERQTAILIYAQAFEASREEKRDRHDELEEEERRKYTH